MPRKDEDFEEEVERLSRTLPSWRRRVLDRRLASALKEDLLDLQLRDTVRAIELCSDGVYRMVSRDGVQPVDAQLAWTAQDRSFMP